MVVGFDGSRAFLKDRTGTENYSFQLLVHLAKIDKENNYIVYLHPGTPGEALQGWADNFQFKIINWPRLWTQGGLALQTFTDQLDVLFVPAHTLPIIRKPGLKTVVTVHDLGAEFLPKTHQLKQRLYLKAMTKYQLRWSSKIIAVSNATKKDLEEKVGINSNKIKVVYEGVNSQLFKPVRDEVLINSLKQFDIEKEKYFLFVGTIQPRKNLERLILSLNKIHNTKLVLVGSRGWLSDEIYKLPKKLGIEARVKFLGRVEDEMLPALYSGALALVFPSLFEGFGLPILEAFSCGCPVLTSNISSMPEIAGNAALLVNPYSVDSITNMMIKISDGKVREELIKKGFKQVEKFSWEKCAKETLEVFKEVYGSV